MKTAYAPASRAERLIASGRIVLAASSLFAVWLDPSEPAKYAQIAYTLLVAYVVYAALLAAWVGRSQAPSDRWRVLSLVVDLVFFTAFTYFTAGPASPFIAFFVFAVVCATVRWHWRGTLWTAAASLTAFLAVSLYFGQVLHDPSFQLYTFIIRGTYLAVIAVLLGYLGFYEQQNRREMSQLAAWPQRLPGDAETLLRDELGHAGRLLRSPEVGLVWSEREEPWLNVARWDGDTLDWQRDAPESLPTLVAPALGDSTFLCLDVDAPLPTVLLSAPDGARRWRGRPLPDELRRRFESNSVLGCALDGETVEGRVLFLGRSNMTADELVLGEVVAGILAVHLDHFHLLAQLQEAAADEERVRLARDLHDGVLQSMTGVALRLAAIRRRVEEGSRLVPELIAELQDLIVREQRDLRFFIQELRPQSRVPSEQTRGDLGACLGELAARVEREWDLKVKLAVDCGDVPELLVRHVYHMVRESLANAVRHGGASQVTVEVVRAEDGRLTIAVSDNGCGFPVRGRYSHGELVRLNLGPRNLRERVAALAGSLELDSSAAGARLDIVLPGVGASSP